MHEPSQIPHDPQELSETPNVPKESKRYSRTSFQRGTPLICQKKAWKEDSYEEKVIKNFLLFKTKNMRRNKTVFN